ncbi:MAG: aminotransferase class I/II-fold pyridoxal phosphate-dependent enzyme [Bacteroidetes bacterium]|nr:aminotransferase class I/II-fold pyridoxal phosphate-dependent enzyme [Bacteroidota bacterium]
MELRDFKLERYLAQHEFTAPYLLCSSDCESIAISELLALEPNGVERLLQVDLGYTEPLGSPELRDSIASQYDRIDASQILVHAGAAEAIFNFCNVCFTKDDHVIVHSPCYQSLFETPHAIGCEVTNLQVLEENRWEIDLNLLEDNIKDNTRGIIINSPHNPTGYYLNSEQMTNLIDIARKHDLYLFSDEVYKDLYYDISDVFPSPCDLYEKAISLGVMSKSYGLAGLRIGWVATQNKFIYERMASFKDYTTICNSAPSELLAIIALKHQEKIIGVNRNIIQDNLKLLDEFFISYVHLFSWVRPKAGPIGFPNINIPEGSEHFCEKLINDVGVLLLPGVQFDSGDRNFRLGFGRKNMPEALLKLEEHIEKNYS